MPLLKTKGLFVYFLERAVDSGATSVLCQKSCNAPTHHVMFNTSMQRLCGY